MKKVFLDTETTANTKNEPVEISYIVCETYDKEFQKYIKPVELCMPSAVVVHGITQDMLDHQGIDIKTNFIESVKELLDNQDTYCIIGYNTDFDIEVINSVCKEYLNVEYKPKHSIDIMKLARKFIPANEIGGYSLDAVYYYLLPNQLTYLLKSRSTHSALVDCRLTKEVFNTIVFKIFGDSNKPLEDIIKFSNEPFILEIWPFGKHKSKTISDVYTYDKQYIQWFMTKCDFRDSWSDLVYTLRTKYGY